MDNRVLGSLQKKIRNARKTAHSPGIFPGQASHFPKERPGYVKEKTPTLGSRGK